MMVNNFYFLPYYHLTTFRIPEEKGLRTKWIMAIRRQDWTPSNSSRLCSAHFLASDYQVRPGASSRWLKDDAIPSVFPAHPSHLQVLDDVVHQILYDLMRVILILSHGLKL